MEAYNPYRFNSKRWDPATGGYDMGFRDYSPGLNRFLTRDMYNGALSDLRLGSDPWTGNRYAFAGGNPITGIEYDGHCPMADEGGCDTNANYEIYVPPAADDTGGTDEGPGESPADWKRSHPSAGSEVSINTEALGNVLKDIGIMGLGAVVTGAGGTLTGGGAVVCGTGVLCPAGAIAIVGGVAISASGAAVTAVGAQRFAYDFGRLFNESSGTTSSGKTSGADIVGTSHSALRPSQDWIDKEVVDNYVARIRAGEKLPAIEVERMSNGTEVILDGHHRYVASQITGVPVEKSYVQYGFNVGEPNWLGVSYGN